MNVKESFESVDAKGVHVKEVFANFGLSIYAAQCLEHGLVNALIYLKLIPSKTLEVPKIDWAHMVDDFAAENFEHTLGRMIKDLQSVAEIPLDLSERLSEALRIRNWLAHDYFRERAREFLSFEGRDKMISELEVAIRVINQADESLTKTLEPVLKKYGITEESIARISEEMSSEH